MFFRSTMRGAWIAAALLACASVSAQDAATGGSTVGVPVTGAVGIVERVDTIMERAQAYDARPNKVQRRNFEWENEWRRPAQNPESPLVASWPPGSESRSVGPSPLGAQIVTTPNFTGATLSDTGAFPPDTMGAVGPTQFIVAVNGRVRSFNKVTGAADGVLNADTDAFFASVMTPPTSSNFSTDPRIRYDRLSGRWFVIAIDVPGGAGDQANRVMIAVSSGPTITATTDFTFFQFQMSTTVFADYPTLGIDANALYIGGNMFSFAGAFSGTHGAVVRKSSVLSTGPIVSTVFANLATNTGAGPFTPQGVDNYDPAAPEGYFIGVDNATFGTLMVRRVTNPGGTPTISANISVTVPTTSFPQLAPHLGNTGGNNGRLDTLDDRLYAAHLRNGRLWTAHNIATNSSGVSGTNTRTSVRWYELQNLNTTPTLVQSGTVFDTATTNPQFYFIPSIMVSGQGHAALGFSMSGNTLAPNAGTIGRLATDATGTTQGPVVNYTNSTAAYNPPADPGGTGGRRWGDYSYTSLDPCDDMTMWTIQEFADSTNSYGVRAVRLLAPSPTATCTATDVMQGQSNVAVAVTGTGFFQPSADVGACRIQLGATASGTGVTVTPTLNSATSISLNVSATAGATVGPRTVTITNPDGQAVNIVGCINVTAGGPTTTVSSLSRVGTGAVCAGQNLSWQATFADAVTGGAPSNFQLVGGTGASISSVTGSGTTRTIATNVGTAAGSLRLDMINATGLSHTPTNLPFTGESVTINANPTVFNVTGGGAYCSGGSGVAVGLSGSQTGVNYQLLRNGSPVGAPIAGTGSALAFGNQTLAGAYTVTASNGTTSCGSTMTGSVDVSINPLPSVNSVTPPMICTLDTTNIALTSTPAGATFAYTASNTAGTVIGFAAGSANPIAQALAGSGDVTYAVTPTLNTCAGSPSNIVQRVTNPRPIGLTLPTAFVGVAYNVQLTAPNALQAVQYALATGTLPAGLTVSSGGLISGIPSAVGTSNITISGTDPLIAGCSVTRAYTIDVVTEAVFANGFE